MRALMVQGTSSSAGKSLLVTALARYFARRGVAVAPFKAQNMSNNARVVEGGEIGTAQWLQALAAGVEPQVRMNPVLVKPERDNRSQVVVLGRVHHALSRRAWRERAPDLWPPIAESLLSLASDFELVLIEGAGSPAEPNLQDCDLANMAVARLVGAPVLIVADIDRGGAFAHLYGTWSLLPESGRGLVRGFVLNKFRGDLSLLAPAPAGLKELTGVPVMGVIPWLRHGLPDEDGAAAPEAPSTEAAPVVAIVRYPTASNLDEFKALEQVAKVLWAGRPDDLRGADLVVLPGSKHVAADLGWLRRGGFPEALARYAGGGGRLLGICGGMQMLGERLEDPGGVDGEGPGLGLLPLVTVFEPDKAIRLTTARFLTFASFWEALSGQRLPGYEIRDGRSFPSTGATEALPGGLGFVRGSVLGIYLHGLFEDPGLVSRLLGTRSRHHLGHEAVFDLLADVVASHLDTGRLDSLAGIR
ncbi:MAG: cobyric acid synthase [Actinomycetota bacterium]